MTKQIPTLEEIIEAWKRADKEAAAKGEKPVGAKEIAAILGIRPYWIWKRFAGQSTTDIKRQHCIRLSPQEIHRDYDELLSIFDDVVTRKGILGWIALAEETGIPEGTWKKTVGGSRTCLKDDFLSRYEEWLRVKKPESPNLEIIARELQGSRKTPEALPGSQVKQTPAYTRRTDARVYGPRLHFSNMTHEPINEQGVIFLFGMVSRALGFDSIECIGPDFPDCEAKRRVGKGEKTQRVQIEFEFKSSHYKDHGHPIYGCDVIVCWEHNWKDCPLEVIELKREIEGLRSRKEFAL
jgi:hypothetical protein